MFDLIYQTKGGIMLVKVFIKRIAKQDKALEVFKLLRKIRAQAMNQNGYISGETMIDPDNPNKIVVISTWGSLEDWKSWKENEDRKAQNEHIDKLLEGPVEYSNYVYSKYYLRVSS
jgi:quinol monooxygenase YgiN